MQDALWVFAVFCTKRSILDFNELESRHVKLTQSSIISCKILNVCGHLTYYDLSLVCRYDFSYINTSVLFDFAVSQSLEELAKRGKR